MPVVTCYQAKPALHSLCSASWPQQHVPGKMQDTSPCKATRSMLQSQSHSIHRPQTHTAMCISNQLVLRGVFAGLAAPRMAAAALLRQEEAIPTELSPAGQPSEPSSPGGPRRPCALPPPHGRALLFLTHHFSLGVLTPIYEAVLKTSHQQRNNSSFHRVTFCHSAPNPRVAFGTVGMPCPRHSTEAATSSTVGGAQAATDPAELLLLGMKGQQSTSPSCRGQSFNTCVSQSKPSCREETQPQEGR